MNAVHQPMSDERRRALRHIQSMAAEVSLQSMIEDIRAKGSVVLCCTDIQALEAAMACAREVNQRGRAGR